MSLDAWSPVQYDKFKRERSQPFFDLMALLKPKARARVLDLGCGTGELTAELHQHLHGEETLGMDSSGEMLKKSSAFAHEGLRFEIGDIQTWSAEKSFDIVLSNAALQWCADHKTLFREIHKALRPGGQLAVQMPMNHDYPTHVLAKTMSLEEPWVSLLGTESSAKPSNLLTMEEYAKLLFDLGFEEQTVFVKVYGHRLESREEVIEWVKGTLLTGFKSRFSDADYEKFVKAFRERLFLQLADEKPFFYPFKRIFLWAQL
jgi:trans-aconitate 2-methyltransferase